MTEDEYIRADAVQIAELVAAGEVTARELAELALSRAHRLQPQLNCIVHWLDPEPWLEQPGDGPFRGVPWMLKDQLELAGTPMTLGSRLLADHRPAHTHPVGQGFLDAGFVPLARTNMSELGLVPATEPDAYGPTHNPWRRGYSPGGSSGGSAAAVAAGIVPLAHAADGGGSIRIPASACGLVGLKPTRGLLPTWSEDPPQGFVHHFAVTRSVRDTAAALDALLGTDHHRRASERCPEAPLRIGVSTRGFLGEPLDAEVTAAVERTARTLEALGHRVEPVDNPLEPYGFARSFGVLWSAAAGVFFKVAHREAPLPGWLRRLTAHPRVWRTLLGLPVKGGSPLVERFTRRLAGMESGRAPSDLWLAEQALVAAAEQVRVHFTDWDLWLTPTLTRPPDPHGALSLHGSVEELERDLFGLIGYTPIANATGIPAISVPAGLSARGLPLGAHLMAAHHREDRLLAVAGQLERARPWPSTAPDQY